VSTPSVKDEQIERFAYTLKELATAYRVSSGLLRLEIARGHLRPARIGRRVVISIAEAERYFKAAGESQAGRVSE